MVDSFFILLTSYWEFGRISNGQMPVSVIYCKSVSLVLIFSARNPCLC